MQEKNTNMSRGLVADPRRTWGVGIPVAKSHTRSLTTETLREFISRKPVIHSGKVNKSHGLRTRPQNSIALVLLLARLPPRGLCKPTRWTAWILGETCEEVQGGGRALTETRFICHLNVRIAWVGRQFAYADKLDATGATATIAIG